MEFVPGRCALLLLDVSPMLIGLLLQLGIGRALRHTV